MLLNANNEISRLIIEKPKNKDKGTRKQPKSNNIIKTIQTGINKTDVEQTDINQTDETDDVNENDNDHENYDDEDFEYDTGDDNDNDDDDEIDINENYNKMKNFEYKSDNSDNDFLYPDLDDPHFNIKIAKKKEFNDTQ